MTNAIRLAGLKASELTDIVRRATGHEDAMVDTWQIDPLGYDCTSPVSAGVYRLTGAARSAGQTVPWALVLKVLRSPAGRVMPNGHSIPRDAPDDPTVFGYWKREALAYQSGLLDELPGALVAPRCYKVDQHADGTIWLWLEGVTEAGACWTPDRYELAARHLGRFNGAYLAGWTPPASPWLGAGWLRSFLDLAGIRMMEFISRAGAWESFLLRDSVSRSVPDRILQLWDARAPLLAALDSLPHTFCHRDAFRPNLFAGQRVNGREQTVAIDWAFAGLGPVGEEIAPLIAMRPAGSAEAYEPWDLEGRVVDGYLHGLQEAGWSGDPRAVRFGYAATAALRYTFMVVAELLHGAGHEAHHTEVARRRGQPIERVVERQVALTHFLLDRADEARALLPALGRSSTVAPAAVAS